MEVVDTAFVLVVVGALCYGFSEDILHVLVELLVCGLSVGPFGVRKLFACGEDELMSLG